MLPAPSGSTCPRHPGVPAQLTCDRCGSFACDACLPKGLAGRFHRCTPDREDPALAPRAKTKIATVSLWLGAASLVPCLGLYFFIGAIACGLASMHYEPELARKAKLGLGMGLLSLAGHLALLAAVVLRNR